MIKEDVQAAWRELGRQLAGWRQGAGHTQQSLAPLVCYTRSSIANIEVGSQHADRGFWRRVDDVLGAGGELVAGYEHADALRRRSRQPVRAKSESTGALSTAEPAQRPDLSAGAALEDVDAIYERRLRIPSTNVDEAKLSYLEDGVLRAIVDNERCPPGILIPRVRQLRDYVDHLLTGRQHPPQRARLYTLASYLSGLLGALALDLGAFRPAHAYSAEAFELADAGGQPDVQAWARAVQSLIAYYAGAYHDALAYAQDGARRSPTGPHSIRLAVNGQARALARLGDRYGVDEAVERAFTLLNARPSDAEVSASLTTGSYCHARTAANAATAYLTIGAPQNVTGYLTHALDAFDQAALRGPQALSRLDLATAALQQDQPEVERACTLAVEAMTLTADQRFESVRQRARQFLAIAQPFAALPEVCHVVDLIVERGSPAQQTPPALPSPP
ncbi:helix-turn-helix transcriptional regulator [Micromonospora sp. 4G57]|uniref:Helix-turn-helix transcriptional regulator n=1 Tax=Micromonospora sicca TaxID=2202420 RepID=A0ABU5JKJ4_9ACTN|nr:MULTISPECIES: helix-turn-helix transcriptional regulator [unclassified Micromonospora]MDZ5447071.1 helix-turn-helix transcriptional regulator [Micromonospora sp. 4G57]MDZ5493052.1 helix-turn-helix transcriptional regulator [Micromonospora sp. 4G53]